MDVSFSDDGAPGHDIPVRVRQTRYEAEGVVSFLLERHDTGDLPEWSPGAHVELVLPSGARRQYSLYGDPGRLSSYRIATRLVADGRGGSAEMHRLRPGDTVAISAVRNNFELREAKSYLFIAGGIGVTPLLPMFRHVTLHDIPSTFIYLGRNPEQMALVDELNDIGAGVQVRHTDVTGIPLAADLLSDSTAEAIYACGPAPLLDDLEAAAGITLTEHQSLHIERFQPVSTLGAGDDTDCKIICSRSGLTVAVARGETYLDSIRRAGVDVPSSCEMGICGTCQIRVTAGTPDHQDMLLTDEERAAGAFLPCVSRSRSTELTVEL
ncbi:MAG: PDR/VanB family oxidoreductase [Mycobacterium sp.]